MQTIRLNLNLQTVGHNCTVMNNYEKLFHEENDNLKKLGVKLNAPATISELITLEQVLNCKLPTELTTFYQYCNGFETDDHLFRVIPIQEIIEYKSELPDNTFHFAEYMIYSDQWLIKVYNSEKYEILNDDHKSKELLGLNNSILKFLKAYLNGGLFGKTESESFWNRINNYT